MQGQQTIAPAVSWTGIINVEIPQLYPVHPYELYGLTKPDLQVAIDTWRYGDYSDDQLSHVSWHQQAIFCARMGLTEDAARYTLLKLADSGRRFPAFWGPGHDWTPDHNWGGSGMIGLQEMLMQCYGRQILLLPAWPAGWDVEFKLHAPLQHGRRRALCGGQAGMAAVTPPERAADVVVMQRQRIGANHNEWESTISYADPATQWCDALPLGNGCMGAMVYGDACAERIYLSDAPSGRANRTLENNNPRGPAIVAEIRRLLSGRRNSPQPTGCASRSKGASSTTAPTCPLATCASSWRTATRTLAATTARSSTSTPPLRPSATGDRNRQRSRTLSSVVRADGKYDAGYEPIEVSYRRESFASHADNVLVMRITCSRTRRAGAARVPGWRRTAVYGSGRSTRHASAWRCWPASTITATARAA